MIALLLTAARLTGPCELSRTEQPAPIGEKAGAKPITAHLRAGRPWTGLHQKSFEASWWTDAHDAIDAPIHPVIMSSRTKRLVTFAPAKVIQPIFTRGNVVLSQDGRVLASCLDEDVLLTDLTTGAELARIEGVSRGCAHGGLHVVLTC